MTGGITRRSKVGGESRFYSPPAMRLQNQGLQQQQQQKLGVGSSRRSGSGSVSGSDDGTSASSSSTKTPHTAGTPASLSSPRVEISTNLDRFIEHTTPTVPAQFFSKTNMREWKNHADDPCPYFVLGDLWESLKEWSAYGAGVPLVLNESDSVIQYYVPYLSGIQLYVNPSKPVIRQRRPGEESDAESSRETSSDDSGDLATTDGQQRCSKKKRQGLNGISITNGPNGPLMGLPGDENETANPPGILVFEYMERDQPYSRVPLSDKVLGLTSQFPELKAYKSCDLTSASWLSVAWYPIYRIPIGPTLQSLDACFLTYHSLSTPLSNTCTDGSNFHGLAVSGKLQDCMSSMPGKMSLPTFGLASYKFKISFWSRNGDYESQNLSSLVSTADKWNRLLQVNHPDYAFFVSHNSYWW